MKEKKPLNVAEKFVCQQMRIWPTLYPDEDSFLNQRVMGGDDFYWKKGRLACAERGQCLGRDRKGRPKYKPYPFRISLDVAQDLMHSRSNVFRSVYRLGEAPIDCLPDDLHKDWREMLHLKLFLDEKIDPEMYATTLEAYCIQMYHCRHNPHANLGHYQKNWEEYWKRIPSFLAELERIRRKQELGCDPPETFIGMGL